MISIKRDCPDRGHAMCNLHDKPHIQMREHKLLFTAPADRDATDGLHPMSRTALFLVLAALCVGFCVNERSRQPDGAPIPVNEHD